MIDFQQWINFVLKREKTAEISDLESKFSAVNVRFTFIKILEWLRIQSQSTTAWEPLRLPAHADWCDDFVSIIKVTPRLNSILTVKDDKVDFALDMPALERNEIVKYVAEHYRPPLMI